MTDVADTVDASEATNVALERFIAKRASQDRRPDPDENEEPWKASCRAHAATRQEEMRAAWAEFHQEQAASLRHTLEALIAHHAQQAEKYGDQPNASEATKGAP